MSPVVRHLLPLLLLHATACMCTPPVPGSGFEGDDEGWLISGNGDQTRPTFQPTGGSPNANLCATDADPADVWYFVAPPTYLGNKSDAAGLMITFEVKTNQQFNLQYGRDVIIAGNGLSLSKSYPRAPGTDWTPRRVFLDGVSGWVVDETGLPATDEDVRSVLRNLTAFRIRGEFVDGPKDTGCLDNVQFGATP
jgi:hypothetical protein